MEEYGFSKIYCGHGTITDLKYKVKQNSCIA